MADFYVALTDDDGGEVSGGDYQRVGVERSDMRFAGSHGLSLTNKKPIEFGVPETTALISGFAVFRSGNPYKPFLFGNVMACCDPTCAAKLVIEPEEMTLMITE